MFKKKSIKLFLFIILLFSAIAAVAIFFIYLNSTIKKKNISNVKKEENVEIKHCSREEYSPKKEFKDWKTYFNDEYCFSIQYPENWQMLESMEHIGPYVVFGKEKLDDSKTYPKIFIRLENMELFTSSLIEQSFLYNADMDSFWQGSEPAFRIKGNFEDSEKAKEIPYNYSDSIIIPRERIDDYSDYIVISYNEKDFNKEDREVFEKMYESFNIAEN
ncbi:MAG: hypothetical protein V1655_04435 [bacterium]